LFQNAAGGPAKEGGAKEGGAQEGGAKGDKADAAGRDEEIVRLKAQLADLQAKVEKLAR
jgi:hypothetical protein